jgi:hypothetical protein
MKARIMVALVMSLATIGATFVAPLSADAKSTPAQLLAQKLLDAAIIPPGAVLAHPVAGDVICQCAGTPSVQPFFAEHHIYIVPGPPTAVEQFLTTHIPKGGSYDGSTGTSGGPNGAGIISIAITYPARGPHVYLKQLAYSMTKKNSSSSWLRVDSQIVWVPNRAADQEVPAAVSATITGYQKTALSGTSGDVKIQLSGKKLATLVTQLNALPLGPENRCMEDLTGFAISLRLKNGERLQISNGFCAGAFDSVTAITGNENAVNYVLSDPSCHFIDDVATLFPSSVKGTHEAQSGCQSWSKSGHTS